MIRLACTRLLLLLLVSSAPSFGVASFAGVSVGGSDSASYGFACALQPGAIDCFQTYQPPQDTDEYEIRGSLTGDYSQLAVGGADSSSFLYACAVQSNSVDCFLPYSPIDINVDYEMKGSFPGEYKEVSIGGSGASAYLYACAIRDGAVDCFNPTTFESTAVTYDIAGTLPGDYSSVSVGGAKSSRYLSTCTTTAAATLNSNDADADNGVDCFDPYQTFGTNGVYERVGVLAGDYTDVSAGGSKSSSYLYTCATKTDNTGVDCFQPYTVAEFGISYDITGTMAGAYSQVDVGGSASSSGNYLYACSVRASETGIDCFEPRSFESEATTYAVKGSVEGAYSSVSVGGGDGSAYVWACAVRSSGEAVDCFQPTTFDQSSTPITYEIKASYVLPTPMPTTSPSTSAAPTVAPTLVPTNEPSLSAMPSSESTRSPTPTTSAAAAFSQQSWVLGGFTVAFAAACYLF